MTYISKTIMLAIAFTLFVLGGCATEQSTQSSEESDVLNIYTTLYPLEYFVKEIGGTHVEVVSILPAGADHHTYEPTSKTLTDIATGDAFIYSGAQLETYAKKIQDALENESVIHVEASNGIALLEYQGEDEHAHEEEHGHEEDEHAHEEEEHGHEEDEHAHEEDAQDHDHGDVDPHVWLDPIRAISLAENIKDTLVELKPGAEQDFEKNFDDLKAKLEKLDEDFHRKLESQERSEIAVTHAAYGYWEKAYGLKQISIAGLSSFDEPSQKQIERVIDTVKNYHIKYLLFEQNIEPKVAKVIQNEANLEALHIHNLSTLTEEDRNNDEDYFTLMYQNLDVLEKALEE
ncbi:metal ABC transporter solute-binding protein, Zn/Mn family [Aquibacillus albus]|uniref:Zinc transport system substrate-binding protein n=1 Tax=Aquibacillus albus TaxID=1168171 RepID=A0ABS2MYB6_9BACI|nr:zinc ABC transporter substrate-binding protein [Aquibacillus albus]MBM7570865.1 zinc transport system substrate-binding protein [Aquibacillus albus]